MTSGTIHENERKKNEFEISFKFSRTYVFSNRCGNFNASESNFELVDGKFVRCCIAISYYQLVLLHLSMDSIHTYLHWILFHLTLLEHHESHLITYQLNPYLFYTFCSPTHINNEHMRNLTNEFFEKFPIFKFNLEGFHCK